MSTVRRLGGGSPSPAPANSYQPTGTAPPVQPSAAASPPAPARPAAQPVPSGIRAPAYAGSAALPPVDHAVDTSSVGQDRGFEKRDDAYWETHALKPGTYDLDVFANKIVDWSVGRVAITLQVSQWDRNVGAKGAPGPHHQRPIDWDHSRPDLIAKIRAKTHPAEQECKCDGCKAHRGLQYWRAEMVHAYAAAGITEAQFPVLDNGNQVIPWWSLFFHQCPDGVMVPVMLSATIAVQAGRQRFPTIRAIRRIESENGRPVQAPMPYVVPPYFAADMRWTVAEEKSWGTSGGFNGTAQVAVLDRNSVPLGHCNLPTYKDL